MKNNKVYRKDGELVVQFKFDNTSSMLDMENQIEESLKTIEESISELEKKRITSELLASFKDINKKKGGSRYD